MACGRFCPVTMYDSRVMSQCHSFVIMHSGAGVASPT